MSLAPGNTFAYTSTHHTQAQARYRHHVRVHVCCPGARCRRLLALDRVQDPGNMGTLMRSALAFGWDGVFLLPGCCDPFNEKAVRASRGAALRLPTCSGTLEDLKQVAGHHGMTLIAAEPEPEEEQPCKRKDGGGDVANAVCLVLGSEGQGLSPEVLKVSKLLLCAPGCEPVDIAC